MDKKLYGLGTLLLVFASLFSGMAYASSFDISINKVTANGQVVTESNNNLVSQADIFSVMVDFTAVQALGNGHVEAVLRGSQSSDVVSDATNTFSLAKGQNAIVALNLVLTDGLRRENSFQLTVKVVDVNGNSEEKTYGLRTRRALATGKLDVSIDRVSVNTQVVAESRTNFMSRSSEFDVLVEFTALEDLSNAHVEAVLRDTTSGNVVADATATFDLGHELSSSESLKLALLDTLKQSNSFELTIKIIDEDGNFVQKVYGIRTRSAAIVPVGGRALDVSIDSVEVESKAVAENENNFVVINEGKSKLSVRARLTSLENVKNAHVDAILAFENGNVVADATATFDIGKDENAVKSLDIPFIGRFEQNNFRLKVRVVDAEGFAEEKVYGLTLSQSKFPFAISTISLNPESNVEAGKNIIATLKFRNAGVVPLDGITAKVSIPELDVSSTKFVNVAGSETSQEFVLKVPDNADTGTYTVRAEIASQFGEQSEVKEIPVFVLGRSEQPAQPAAKISIVVPALSQDMKNDGTEIMYQIALRNDGTNANAYTLLLDGAGWADLRLAESNTFVLQPSESKTIAIYASTRGNALGAQAFLATLKGNGKVLKQIQFVGNVTGAKRIDMLMGFIGIFLAVLAVLLIALVFFGMRKLQAGSEMQEAEKPYY